MDTIVHEWFLITTFAENLIIIIKLKFEVFQTVQFELEIDHF